MPVSEGIPLLPYLPSTACSAGANQGFKYEGTSIWVPGIPFLPGPLFFVCPLPGVSLTGAVHRGSAVGYFNEHCQGLQSGEEPEGAVEHSLAKLGLGRGGLARHCSAATAARSSPAGTSAPFRIRSQRLFPTLCPSFLSCSIPAPHCFWLCLLGEGGEN